MQFIIRGKTYTLPDRYKPGDTVSFAEAAGLNALIQANLKAAVERDQITSRAAAVDFVQSPAAYIVNIDTPVYDNSIEDL